MILVIILNLESLSTQPTRVEQLRQTARVLAGPSLLVGDFNFCSRRNWSADYSAPEHGTHARGSTGDFAGVLGWLSRSAAPEPLDNDALTQQLPEHTDVWARRDGRWLAVAAHVTRG